MEKKNVEFSAENTIILNAFHEWIFIQQHRLNQMIWQKLKYLKYVIKIVVAILYIVCDDNKMHNVIARCQITKEHLIYKKNSFA